MIIVSLNFCTSQLINFKSLMASKLFLKCPSLKKDISLFLKDHFDACTKYPVDCLQGCRERVARDKVGLKF